MMEFVSEYKNIAYFVSHKDTRDERMYRALVASGHAYLAQVESISPRYPTQSMRYLGHVECDSLEDVIAYPDRYFMEALL